jgi:hypothetical protein
MAFLVVRVNSPTFFIPGFFVRSVAKRLIFGETAQTDPNGFFLRLNLERSLFGFEDGAHDSMVKIKKSRMSRLKYFGNAGDPVLRKGFRTPPYKC